ncbi:vacuolar ATP synthase subunit s1 (ATP6S1) domain-containing protein [Phthorimaea operculella]|nr:vacuolar ATP synthase subunit s1 (ATP6S1) domain-containing protein [Phthorimaea operculella]
MAFCRGLSFLLVLSVVSISFATEVPVFMFGDIGRSSIKHSALSSVPANEFRRILKEELLEDPFTVVFIEETLSVEDFSRKIDEDSSFPYLESKVYDAVYFPLVDSPLKVLNKLVDADQADHVKLTDSGLSADVSGDDGKYLFINLKDAKEGESRADLLRRHNDFIEDMVTKLQERYDKVVAIYTAHYPSWTVAHSRVRRDVAEAKNHTRPVTLLSFAGLHMYFQTALLHNGKEESVLTGAVGDESSYVNSTEMNSTINFADGTKTMLHFTAKGGYWFLDQASVSTPTAGEQDLYPLLGDQLFAFNNFSLRCAQNITLYSKSSNKTSSERWSLTFQNSRNIKLYSKSSNKTSSERWSLTFQNSRIQPYFSTNSSEFQFGEPLNCVGFFTAPIWAGLFVVFLLLAITFFGITMMMDIRTMDRFDDPKGKTITINAAE